MITAEKNKKSDNSSFSFDRVESYVKRSLHLLESSEVEERKKGFCLVYSRFDLLPTEIKEIIIKKWDEEEKSVPELDKLYTAFNKRFR